MTVKFHVLIPLCSVVPCVGLKCRELQLLRWWQGYFNGIDSITSFRQYNRPCLPVLFWRVVFRNRTGIIHFRLMKMISFQCKTAKNQFYLLMMLIVNKTLLNLRSQNRTRKTGFGCASTGFARPILGPSIFASSYFQ